MRLLHCASNPETLILLSEATTSIILAVSTYEHDLAQRGFPEVIELSLILETRKEKTQEERKESYGLAWFTPIEK